MELHLELGSWHGSAGHTRTSQNRKNSQDRACSKALRVAGIQQNHYRCTGHWRVIESGTHFLSMSKQMTLHQCLTAGSRSDTRQKQQGGRGMEAVIVQEEQGHMRPGCLRGTEAGGKVPTIVPAAVT
ncbi:hypothetical protein NQZ68_023079 [Dissostichus eleginoides]|nr:hypothetical protein NQZ68_023079 [Dissostichus eleginoides]